MGKKKVGWDPVVKIKKKQWWNQVWILEKQAEWKELNAKWEELLKPFVFKSTDYSFMYVYYELQIHKQTGMNITKTHTRTMYVLITHLSSIAFVHAQTDHESHCS